MEQQRLKFMSDRLVAQTELRKKLGQLLYLNNLAKVRIIYNMYINCCAVESVKKFRAIFLVRPK